MICFLLRARDGTTARRKCNRISRGYVQRGVDFQKASFLGVWRVGHVLDS